MTTAAEEVVPLCQDLIRIDTTNYGPTPDTVGERQAAEYIAAKLDEVGIASEFYEPAPNRTTLIARWEPDGCDPDISPLLIHGHTDVVPADASDWQVHPLSGELRDGCVWGRGAVDMKSFDAMVLAVVRDRQRTGRPPRRPIRLAFTADEEASSSLGARWLVREHPETVADCTHAIGEVGGFSVTVRDDLRLYLIQSAEKGLAWLNLTAEGTAGHGSMLNPDNPVTELAAAVARIGAYRWPHRVHPAQQAFLDAVSDALGHPVDMNNIEESLAPLGSISDDRRRVHRQPDHAGCYKHNVIPMSWRRRPVHPRARAGALRHHRRTYYPRSATRSPPTPAPSKPTSPARSPRPSPPASGLTTPTPSPSRTS